MKILIADDHDLVRDMLSAFLSKETGVVVSTAANFDEASRIISREGPFDVVLLDYSMPGMKGLASLHEAKELNLNNPVALLSGTATRSIAEQALSSGAAGFLPKTLSAKTFAHAVRFMAAGEQYAPVQFMTEKEPEKTHPLKDILTKRELEVLKGLVEGQSNKEIARNLDLQEVTVKLHVKTLCRKIAARNRTSAAMIAKDAGLF
jgi:two-component system nitrate/nitrite response regulator NarL